MSQKAPDNEITLTFMFGYPVAIWEEPICDELPTFGMSFLEKMKSE